MRPQPQWVARVLHTMSLSLVPVDGRLLRRGGALLLLGLLGVIALTLLTPTGSPLRGLPADVLKNTVAACHVLGMSLCTAACLPKSVPVAVSVCFSWSGLHVLKELSEHPLLSARLLSHSPDWLRAVWLLDDGGQYVLRDSFQPLEIAVPLLAGAAAIALILQRSPER